MFYNHNILCMWLFSFRHYDDACPASAGPTKYTAQLTNTLISTKENGKPVRSIPKPLISARNSQISKRYHTNTIT